MIRAISTWNADRRQPPLEAFRRILRALNSSGWSGRLQYTKAGGAWEDIEFSPYTVSRLPPSADIIPKESKTSAPIELTHHDQVRELFLAAATASKPGGGAPLPK